MTRPRSPRALTVALTPAQATARAIVADLPALCTVQETARALRRSPKTVREYIAAGRLEKVRLALEPGGRVLVTRASIERLIARALGEAEGWRR